MGEEGGGGRTGFVPWALLGPVSMALSDWGTPLSNSAPRGMVFVFCGLYGDRCVVEDVFVEASIE